MIVFLFSRSFFSEDIQISGQATPATVPATTASDLHLQNSPGVIDGKININTATAEELSALPGIGSVLANRIVDYRETNGLFKNADELLNVPGIGEKKLEGIRKYIVI
jgi:competence protein ComEA